MLKSSKKGESIKKLEGMNNWTEVMLVAVIFWKVDREIQLMEL